MAVNIFFPVISISAEYKTQARNIFGKKPASHGRNLPWVGCNAEKIQYTLNAAFPFRPFKNELRAKNHVRGKKGVCNDPGKEKSKTSVIDSLYSDTRFRAVRHNKKLAVKGGTEKWTVPLNLIVPENYVIACNRYPFV